MTFATIKENQASTKFLLVRANPARFLNDLLTSIGGGKYTIDLPTYAISNIQENGVDLTSVTTTPAAGEYYFNESTGLLTIYPVSAPSSSNAIVMLYYRFFTSEIFRTIYEDPENSSTSQRDWLPIIQTNPVISQSIENITNGILSISSSSMSLINDNDNDDFNNYMTVNDSWYLREIKIWLCLDELGNIKKIFDGKIANITVTKQSVNLSLEDNLGVLALPCLLGDDPPYSYYTLDSNVYLDPNKNNTPIPFIFGKVSRYKTLSYSVAGLTQAQALDPKYMNESVCTSYSSTISTTTNRQWGICRITSSGVTDFGHTPTSIDNSAGGYTRLDTTSAVVAKIFIGDTFEITYLGSSYYVQVFDVDRVNNYIYVTKQGAIATTAIVVTNAVPSLAIVQDNIKYYPLYSRDYAASITATNGGNKYLDITFVDNFEAVLGMNPLDPSRDQVFYRIKPDPTSAKHGNVVEYILEKSNLIVNTASISAANTDIDVNCNFSIPKFDEIDFNPIYNYLEGVFSSVLSYIMLNNDFEIEYKVLQTPTSTDDITETDIIRDSISYEYDYKDIVTQIIGYNPHYSSIEAIGGADTKSSNKAKYLHGINKSTRFVHYLENFSLVSQRHIDLRSERNKKVILSTKLKNLDSLLGDEFQYEGDSVKITRISKTTNEVTLVLTDLYNL